MVTIKNTYRNIYNLIAKRRFYCAIEYVKMYSLLSKLMGFKQKIPLLTKTIIFYEYSKYLYYSKNSNHQYVMRCVPRTLFGYCLSHKTRHYESGSYAINKIKFYKLLKKSNLNVPQTICYSHNGELLDLNDEIIDINSLSDTKKYFAKPIGGLGGRSAKIISKKDIMNLSDGYLVQEILENGSTIRSIAGDTSAFNTIRIWTYKSFRSKSTIILEAHLKLGLAGTIADNIRQGSIGIPIEINSGHLAKYGFTELNRDNVYAYDSKSPKFEGQRIYEWFSILEEVNKASQLMDSVFIGWDIGISNKGIVFVEANSGGDYFIPQAFDKPFLESQLITDFLANPADHKWIAKWQAIFKSKYSSYLDVSKIEEDIK